MHPFCFLLLRHSAVDFRTLRSSSNVMRTAREYSRPSLLWLASDNVPWYPILSSDDVDATTRTARSAIPITRDGPRVLNQTDGAISGCYNRRPRAGRAARKRAFVAAVLFVITARKNGFVATCERPAILALGASADLAAENALLAARAVLGRALPSNLIVRIANRRSTTIVMQKTNQPINLNRQAPAGRSNVKPTAEA